MEIKERVKRIAIYLRKSRNNDGEETEETLQKHRQRLLEIATKNGWSYMLFQEVGSSMNEHRIEYQKMISSIKQGLFDAVLSVNLARVTRDDSETPRFMSLLRNENILFITDGERIYDLEVQEDWQALKFTGFVNNWEYENIKAQLRKGKIDAAKMGKWSNGTPNFGYVYNRITRNIDIDPINSDGVKLAFQMVIDGIGVDRVAIELNKLGYLSNRGKPFHGNSIYRMIRSPIYKGWIVSNRVKGRNIYDGKLRPKEQWIVKKNAVNPHIIDEDTWELANKKLDDRKQLSPRGKQRKHGLSSLIKCYKCGKSHAIATRKDRNNVRIIQPCNKKGPYGESCNNRGLNYQTMMLNIIQRVEMRKQQLEEILIKLDFSESSSMDSMNIKEKQLQKRIDKVQKALSTLQLQLEEGDIDIDFYRERSNIRKRELSDLHNELIILKDTSKEDEIESINQERDRLQYFINEWHHLPDKDLNEALMSFIEKIVWYYPKECEIEEARMEIHWK